MITFILCFFFHTNILPAHVHSESGEKMPFLRAGATHNFHKAIITVFLFFDSAVSLSLSFDLVLKCVHA